MKMKRWLQQPQDAKQAKAADEIAAVLKRFGDEQSTLLDRFERLSVEVQLNQAMLGRSLSDPSLAQPAHPRADRSSAHRGTAAAERRGHGGPSSFRRVLKKLFGPILGKKSSGSNNVVGAAAAAAAAEADSRIPNYQYSKAFSRSLRI
ncbi:uncharacterized protein LOC115677097 [Syzygium oleosum]|uniref:uncharacterized protein LOC115677097 n=1 Tax=Syzygium oleosum TaxID=219896 RepID=UPI0011D29AF2|nr:uncharacterized protein LOC115677097 [Syzygium oleosum]